MENIIFGIATIIICSIGYYFSWKYFTKGNTNLAVFFLVICGFILRIYVSADLYLHAWDERYHGLVAKNIIEHPLTPTLYDNPILPYDFKDWSYNHIWVHKQPLPLWSMAASLYVFGINEIALRIPSILLTTIGIWLIFFIGRFFFDRKVGYLAAFFYSINGLIIELTGGRIATDHIDIFFLFFIELAVFFSILFATKKKTVFNILAGVCIGFAILSKWLPALIVLPIWILIVYNTRDFSIKKILLQFGVLLATSIIISLPWQVYIFNVFPVEANWEASYNLKHLTHALSGRTGPFYYFLNKIRINYGDLIYLPLIWFLIKTIKNRKEFNRWAIIIWVFIPLLFFSFVKTKMQGYVLFISPALFLITAEFFFYLNNIKNDHRFKWVVKLILILLIALPIRYTLERVKPFKNRNRHPQWVQDLKQLNEEKIEKGVLFNYNRPIEAMFYTDLVVYSKNPSLQLINELKEKGYTVIINSNRKATEIGEKYNDVRIEYLSEN